MEGIRNTTPAASASVASQNFFDDAATPPRDDARRGIYLDCKSFGPSQTAARVTGGIETIKQIQNHADTLQVDPEITSQMLNDMYAMYSLGLEQDPSRWRVRRLNEAKVDEPAHDLRMHARARCSIFEPEKVAARL
jgi:hypothetical protein